MTHRPYTLPSWQAAAARDGRVTLLVVPLKVQPDEGADVYWSEQFNRFKVKYPYWGMTHFNVNTPFAPGDLIWCREAYIGAYAYEVNEYKPKDWGNKPSWFPADGPIPERFANQFWHKARSPVTMPKWAARTWLRATGVEVRRVQTITADEASEVGALQFEHKGDYNALDGFYSMWMQTYGSYDQWAAFVAVEKISKEDV